MTATVNPQQRELRVLDRVLAFPLTPFTAERSLDLAGFRTHIEHLLSFQPGALFVGCGTGEFSTLTPEEHRLLVQTAVEAVAGRVSVVAGVGINVGIAREQARNAEAAGADGLLLLPPYLVAGPQAGLEAYVRDVVAATDLPVILYQRGIARYEPETVARLRSLPQLVGFKDGIGDLEHMNRIRLAAGDDLLYFNGMPTAELQADAYRGVGTTQYSSAVFAMAPEIAVAFFEAWSEGDTVRTLAFQREFFAPLAALRDRVPGYSVALIKAGAALRGAAVGPVRAPLVEVTDAHRIELKLLLDRGLELARAAR